MKVARYLILGLLLCTSALGSEAEQSPLEAVLANHYACQALFLKNFVPYNPDHEFSEEDGKLFAAESSNVYHVHLGGEAEGRLHIYTNQKIVQKSARFADFINQFAQKAPELIVPLTQIVRPIKGHEQEKASLSLRVGKKGTDYLEEQLAFSLRRALVVSLWSLQFMDPGAKTKHIQSLENSWTQAKPKVREQLREDLIFVHPEFAEIPEEELMAEYVYQSAAWEYDKVEPLFTTLAFKRLPESLQPQLANLAAIVYTLGLEYITSEDWRVVEAEGQAPILVVNGMDRWSSGFANATMSAEILSPFEPLRDSGFKLDRRFAQMLREKVSPRTKEFLKKLTDVSLQDLAMKFPGWDAQFSALIQRAHHFLQIDAD